MPRGLAEVSNMRPMTEFRPEHEGICVNSDIDCPVKYIK